MLVNAKFHADFMAYDVMTLYLYIFSDFLASQANRIQT